MSRTRFAFRLFGAVTFFFAAGACTKRTPPPAPTQTADSDAATTSADLREAPDAGASGAADAALHPLASRPWNVVLISVDSLRADMPWAGYPRAIAPRMTDLHDKSVSYTRAYSTSSFTSKSVPGWLTGRAPSELTRSNTFFTAYYDKSEFFCTALATQDIPCVGAHAHAYFGKGQAGFDHGFRQWKLVPGITFDYQTDPYVTSDKLTPIAIDMLSDVAQTGRPFFAWFHYMDPHDEYKSHVESPHFGKRARDLYDEEVFFTDLWIGKLLDFVQAQPWAARTVIVLTADHGEAFGEHGITRHAHEVWEELVHVPLFIHVPGIAPRVIDTPRGHADLAPTFVDLLGATDVPKMRGTSLVSELGGGEAPARDVVVDLPQDDYNERRRALVHDRYKLIAFGDDVRFALYDLEADPREGEDLFWKRRDLAEEMKRRYKEVSSAMREVPPRGGVPKRDR